MKNIFLIVLLFAFASTFAQTNTVINETTVVKDSSGVILPYLVWQKFTKSGDYTLQRKSGETEFTLHKLNAQEKLMLAERKKSRVATMAKPKSSEVFKEGEKFSADRFTDLDGNKYDLKKTTDKIYVFNFWFINCAPCKAEIPELNQIVSKYKDNKDVVFIGIALDDRYALKDFLKTFPFSYNIVSDGRDRAHRYGIKGYPTHVIVGKDGLIKFSTVGLAANTVYWIEKTIAEQVSAQQASTTSGR